MRRIAWALPAVAALVCGCGAGSPAPQATGQPPSPAPSSHRSDPATPRASATPAPGNNTASAKARPDAVSGGPELFRPTRTGILSGKVVAVDPGHNGGNFAAASVIGKLIWNGRETESCDTTGAETDAGYTEAQFNWNVALYLTADLRAEGATVALTRTSNTGVGPCVTERAAIGNQVHANAAVSIHADGGPPGGRGFAILEPVADGRKTPSSAPPSSSAPTCGPHSSAGPGSLSAATTEPTVSSPATTWPASTCPPFRRCSSNAPTCATPPTRPWSPLCGGRPRPPARSPPG